MHATSTILAAATARIVIAPRRLCGQGAATRAACRRRAAARPAQRQVGLAVRAFQEGSNYSQTEAATTTLVTFTMKHKVHFAQQMLLIGSAPQLGKWCLDSAVRLSWSDGHLWTATVELPTGADVEYKFVVQDPTYPEVWESCLNRQLAVDPSVTQLSGKWDKPFHAITPAYGAVTPVPRDRPLSYSATALRDALESVDRQHVPGSAAVASVAAATGAALADEAALTAKMLESLGGKRDAHAAHAAPQQASATGPFSNTSEEGALAAEVLQALAPAPAAVQPKQQQEVAEQALPAAVPAVVVLPAEEEKPEEAAEAAPAPRVRSTRKSRQLKLSAAAEAAVGEVIAAAEASAKPRQAQPAAQEAKPKVAAAAATTGVSNLSKPGAASASKSHAPSRPSFRPKLAAPSPVASTEPAAASSSPFFPSSSPRAAPSSEVAPRQAAGRAPRPSSRHPPATRPASTPSAAAPKAGTFTPEQVQFLKRSGKL